MKYKFVVQLLYVFVDLACLLDLTTERDIFTSLPKMCNC